MDWNTVTLPNSQFNKDLDNTYMSRIKRLNSMDLLHKTIGINKNLGADRGYIKEQLMAGDALFEETAEGSQEAQLFQPREVANWRVAVKVYKRAIKVTREAADDDFKRWIPKYVSKLADSATYTVERDFVDRNFNTAFTYNASRDKRDGVALCSTTHSVGLDGLTNANAAATPAALSESTLADAITGFAFMKNDDGLWVHVGLKKFKLIVAPGRVPYARQIVNSMGSLTLQQSAAVVNLTSDYDIQVVTSPFLTGTNRWFLVAVPEEQTSTDETLEGDSQEGPILLWKDMFALDFDPRKNPDVMFWIGRYRMAQYCNDYKWVYGVDAS